MQMPKAPSLGVNKPLIWRDLIRQLNIELHNLKSCEEYEVKRLLKEYKELYDEGIGTYKFMKISLRLKPGAVPIFTKPRPVPFEFKDKIKKRVKYIKREWCDSVGR